MKFFASSLVTGLLASSAVSAFSYERLDKDKAMIVILDMQEGLFQLTRDFDHVVYRNAMYAHAEIGKIFNIPTVLTSSTEIGPNGPLPNEILEMYPTAPLIKREGEVNAWDDPKFRDAIKAANRTQIIIGGIVTDVCTAHLALSLREAGYSVWANAEASGTTTELLRSISNDRMRDAGVHVVSFFSIVCDLMRDWRLTPGAKELMPFLDKYYPAYGMLARGHRAAIQNGTVLPGEDILP